MKNRTLISLLGLIAISSTGIGGCDPEEEKVVCPRCDDMLSWDTTNYSSMTSYGGLSQANYKDSSEAQKVNRDHYAWKMLEQCPGWSIFEKHAGGYGNTLEIASCNNGLVLVWADNMFYTIKLSQGWTGTTSTKMAIGSDYQDFIKAYPDYTSDSTLIDGSGKAKLDYTKGQADFENNKLIKLEAR